MAAPGRFVLPPSPYIILTPPGHGLASAPKLRLGVQCRPITCDHSIPPSSLQSLCSSHTQPLRCPNAPFSRAHQSLSPPFPSLRPRVSIIPPPPLYRASIPMTGGGKSRTLPSSS